MGGNVTSDCCGAPVVVAGVGSGPGDTHWYECTACGKACDCSTRPRTRNNPTQEGNEP